MRTWRVFAEPVTYVMICSLISFVTWPPFVLEYIDREIK